MMRRLRDLARLGVAAGLLSALVGPATRADEPSEPVPGASMLGETIDVLRARQTGALEVDARGAGDARVELRLHNVSAKRLHVILPPGLVASAASGQFQSMGLGAATNRPGAFGRFESPGVAGTPGFRSIPVSGNTSAEAITVPAGQDVTIRVPAVCLNLGLPDPAATNRFALMDVSEYSPDTRVRKALRSLATLGTDRKVAQVVMWHVCNGYSLPQIAKVAPKVANRWEMALADRFIEALDTSTGSDLVDPAYLTAGRVFVRVQGDGDLSGVADRLADSFDDSLLFGLPTRTVRNHEVPTASGPALYLVVTLSATTDSQTTGRIAVHGMARDGEWVNGGVAKLAIDAPASSIDGLMLAEGIDRSVASQFIKISRVGRTDRGMRMRVENGLPMTVAGLVLNTDKDGGAPVALDAIGVGPLRSLEIVLPADEARVDRLELNGL